jgi:hypothetical protein
MSGFEVLDHVRHILPTLLRDDMRWHSLLVDYHPPIVERVWCPWENHRIYLHRIHPCEASDALLHRHVWPSWMRVERGAYEMGIGYGESEVPPKIAATVILPAEAHYSMLDPHAWHYVRPLGSASMSLMVTGEPWKNVTAPKSDRPLGSLMDTKRREIMEFFRSKYP